MNDHPAFLIVDDAPSDVKLIVQHLRRKWPELEFERVDELAGMRAALQKRTWSAVLCDWSMPQFSAIRALELVGELGLDVPFILVTGTIGEEAAVEAMRAGAKDYILKDKLARLAPAIEREIRDQRGRDARRRTEEALRVQGARFQALIEKSSDGILLNARDGTLLYASPTGKELLGVDATAGVNVVDFVHPADRARVLPIRARMIEHPGSSERMEFRIVRPDGACRWLEFTVTNLLSEPAVGAIVGNFRDVTERNDTVTALRASESRFRALSESGIVGIAISTNAGAFVDANDAFLKMLGYTREDLLAGKVRWDELTPPDLRRKNVEVIAQLARDGSVPAWEKEYLRKDGTRVPCLVGLSAIDAEQNVLFAIDLTERRRIEAALAMSESQFRQAQKMEAIGRLAGGVAHDFNNMLSVILSYSALIGSGLAAGDPIKEDVEEISKAGRRAADLTRQLLLFSRQEVLEPKVLDLGVLLANMNKMIRRLVGEDVEVATVLAGALGRVRADAGSLEQVVMNLVVNARDAMPTGGTITITTANVTLDGEYAKTHHGVKAGSYVMLSVEDTGIGMDLETQVRIFEPFFTTKGIGKGTGLGLSTVFGIVQQSNGAIAVESEPGRGAKFTAYLPRVDDVLAAQSPTLPPKTLHGGETVLLVEDEDSLRMVARGILKRFGYHVVEARNGDEAMKLCAQSERKIDLLLSDVVMPKMSGPDLARLLSGTHPEMRILCMSGYTDDSVVRHGLVDAQFPFLQKPFTPESLGRKVREVLDSPREATPRD